MMKNTFYFTLKDIFILNISRFLSWYFGDIEKRLDLKDKVNFKIYDFTTWPISQEVKAIRQWNLVS